MNEHDWVGTVHEVRDQRQRADAAIAASAEGATLTTVAIIAVTLGASFGFSYVWGGSKTVGPQLFYAPIIIAATRFGHIGALAAAVAAGFLCGPLLPFDVELGVEQSAGNWILRLVFFVVIGQVVAALHLRSLPAVQDRLDARHFRQGLVEALREGQIRPVYQPFVDLSSGRIVGVEALARWYTTDGDVLPPSEFIPRAEAARCVTAIDLEILRQASVQVAGWRAELLADTDDFCLSINLSGRGFDDPHLAERVRDVLADAELDPSVVVVEVTETALIADLDRAAARMAELKAIGVRLAIDDFGVGQSSLAALHRYPIDVIKLDRTFLALTAADRLTLLSAVVDLAEGLSSDLVVAEGIETPTQLRGVVAAGCHHGQGFLFDQPLTPEVVERALAAGAYHLPLAVDDRVGRDGDGVATPADRPV